MNSNENDYEKLLKVVIKDLRRRAEIRVRNAQELISKGTIARMLAEEDMALAISLEGKLDSITERKEYEKTKSAI